MTSGTPLSNTQKEYITANKEMKFIDQIAGELGISRGAVKRIVDENE